MQISIKTNTYIYLSVLFFVVHYKTNGKYSLLTKTLASFGFVTAGILASISLIDNFTGFSLILIGLIPFVIATPFMLKIEQVAGYYVCCKCGHKYVPKYKNVFWAMHIGRTRYMKCPNCGKWSWQKKVLEDQD